MTHEQILRMRFIGGYVTRFMAQAEHADLESIGLMIRDANRIYDKILKAVLDDDSV